MKARNLHIYTSSDAEAKQLIEDYRLIGFDVDRDGLHLTVLTLPKPKKKKDADEDRKPRRRA